LQKPLETFSSFEYHVSQNRKKASKDNAMVRMSKPERRRHVNFKRPSAPGIKGPSQQTVRKLHVNAITGDQAVLAFIPKISR
jgi:hypothetical protein